MLVKTYETFICFCLHPLELTVLNDRLCLTKEQQLPSQQIPSEYLSRGLDNYCSFCSHLRPLRCPFVSSASRPEPAHLPRIRGGKGEYSRDCLGGYELSVIICRLTTDRSLVLWTDPSRPPDPLSSPGRAPVVVESFVTGDDKAILRVTPAHVPGVIEDWSSRGALVGYRCVGPPRPPGRQST